MIRILATVFTALLGLAFGSFLNVCLSRWPEGESVVTPRSYCRSCGQTLPWWQNVPLLSWLALRGRCRSCKAWIGWRYPLVELAVGGLWATVAWRFPANAFDPNVSRVSLYASLLTALGLMIFYWLLVALAVLDAENLWLPNKLTLPGTAAGFAFAILSFATALKLETIPLSDEAYLFQYNHSSIWYAVLFRIVAILVAGGVILLIRWVYWLVRRQEGIGLGDAKLMAMLGAWLGLPGALLALFFGVMLGSAAALALLVVPRTSEDSERSWAMTKLPLGTFLCIGGAVSALWGERIVAAYLRWVGLR